MRATWVMVLVLAACGPAAVDETTTTVAPKSSSTTATTLPRDDLSAARTRWGAASIDTYHFVFQDDCGECQPSWSEPRTIAVWGGEVLDGRRQGIDIDGLFAAVTTATSDGRSVEVTYHPELGYPTEIWIDREARAYDGGTHLLVHELEPGLPGRDVSVADLESAWQRWEDTRPPAYEYRTDIVCGCPFDVTLWTLVDGDRVADWEVEWAAEEALVDLGPMTMEQLFSDLHHLLSEGEVVEGGARITGGAEYHPQLGHPTWIGLDVEILDPDSDLGDLPPRLVFIVRDVEAHDLAESEYSRALERWADVGPDDYQYELTIHDIFDASFSPPHLVVVEDGVVSSITVDGVEVDPDTVPAYAIDDLFAQIARWEADGWEVDGLYDERLGHPVLVTAHDGEEAVVFSIARLIPG